ncbi:MbtH family NRPS accessory protein [Streptomyces sp. NPDC001250]|uniref:MbtH family protein n=1 Tax=Streptomyces sp. NPDC001250 TaxID=3154382 RepID=UPI003326D78C
MSAHDPDPFDEYAVVLNGEEQYSVWPTARRLPPGWSETGDRGSHQHCLDRIGELWLDMRPRSLRAAMAPGTLQDADA